MKKILIIIGVIIVLVVIAVLLYVKFYSKPNLNQVNNILYSRSATWGPCPPGSVCDENLIIFSSGKVVEEPKPVLKNLTSDKIKEIKQAIRDTGIMDKTCEKEVSITDYYVNYEINLDGKNKTINWPSCLSEINEIDKVIGIKAEQSH